MDERRQIANPYPVPFAVEMLLVRLKTAFGLDAYKERFEQLDAAIEYTIGKPFLSCNHLHLKIRSVINGERFRPLFSPHTCCTSHSQAWGVLRSPFPSAHLMR